MSLQTIFEILAPYLPADDSGQTSAAKLVERMAREGASPKKVMDLGCGVGHSKALFREQLPDAEWTGIDIASSPEVNAREGDDSDMITFNGVNIPFRDGHFDLIYTNQVLEHVRHPEKLLAEVARVLSDDGVFVGQTSQLEPYHSYSLWNFTVYGFNEICRDAGLEIVELRPGIDSMTLIERSYRGRPKSYSKWFSEESPMNQEIEEKARNEGRNTQIAAFRKLLYCGQFCFIVRKSDQSN